MQGLVFWLVFPLLWLISILPFKLFYAFSDVVCFLVYRVFGYRRKTVAQNLKLCFPNKTDKERKQIEKKFYNHMCDMFLETIKTLSISEKELKNRFVFNPEDIEKINKLDKSTLLMCDHYASYEWMISMELYGLKPKSYGVYKRIRNKKLDNLIRNIRGKFNTELIESHQAVRTIIRNQQQQQLAIYGMIADQSPKLHKANFWTDFMGVTIPFFTASEKMATQFDMAVVYLEVKKVKRGFYQARLKPISLTPKEITDFEITKKYVALLEQQIKKQPEFYLWTHKRWKHRNATPPKHAVISRR